MQSKDEVAVAVALSAVGGGEVPAAAAVAARASSRKND